MLTAKVKTDGLDLRRLPQACRIILQGPAITADDLHVELQCLVTLEESRKEVLR